MTKNLNDDDMGDDIKHDDDKDEGDDNMMKRNKNFN